MQQIKRVSCALGIHIGVMLRTRPPFHCGAFVPQLRRALAAQTELRAQLRSSEERWALRESELQLSMSRAQQVRPSTLAAAAAGRWRTRWRLAN